MVAQERSSHVSRLWRLALPAVCLTLLAVAPFIVGGYWQNALVVAMLYAVVASNWDITLGYAAVFNWAHAAIFVLGAYAAAILSTKCGVSPWLCLPAAALVSMLAGALVCLPVLRLKGIYVALVTFAFGELCRLLVLSQPSYTGGHYGITLIPSMRIGDYSFLRDGQIGYYYLALAVLVLSTALLLWMVRTRFGLSIMALRDYEEYAVSRGVPLARQRLLTFIVSSFFTGITGGLYAFYLSVVSPDLFGFGILATLLAMVLVGGLGTIWGPIMGAFAMTFLTQSMISLGPWSYLITAMLTVAVLLFYPEGIIGLLRQLACWRPRQRVKVAPLMDASEIAALEPSERHEQDVQVVPEPAARGDLR